MGADETIYIKNILLQVRDYNHGPNMHYLFIAKTSTGYIQWIHKHLAYQPTYCWIISYVLGVLWLSCKYNDVPGSKYRLFEHVRDFKELSEQEAYAACLEHTLSM